MPSLFGVDIAAEIGAAFSGQLVKGVLQHKTPGTRTAGSLTAGTNPVVTDHSFEGFLEIKEVRRSGQLGAQQMSVLSIIGASVKPAVVPAVNDRATLESLSVEIVEILKRDPAGAMYECAVE